MEFLFVKESHRSYKNDCDVWIDRHSLEYTHFFYFRKEVL